MIMNGRLSVAAVAVLIALGGIAEADVLTAGPVYAGPGQLNGRVFCWALSHRHHERDDFQPRDLDSIKVPASVALTGDSCNTGAHARKILPVFRGDGCGHLYLPGKHQRH